MPSSSAKQHRFMEAVAHNPEFAKKAGVPQNVGQDFVQADKGPQLAAALRKDAHQRAPMRQPSA